MKLKSISLAIALGFMAIVSVWAAREPKHNLTRGLNYHVELTAMDKHSEATAVMVNGIPLYLWKTTINEIVSLFGHDYVFIPTSPGEPYAELRYLDNKGIGFTFFKSDEQDAESSLIFASLMLDLRANNRITYHDVGWHFNKNTRFKDIWCQVEGDGLTVCKSTLAVEYDRNNSASFYLTRNQQRLGYIRHFFSYPLAPNGKPQSYIRMETPLVGRPNGLA